MLELALGALAGIVVTVVDFLVVVVVVLVTVRKAHSWRDPSKLSSSEDACDIGVRARPKPRDREKQTLTRTC